MSFTLNWPHFSEAFIENAKELLSDALNKGDKPAIIADHIIVQDLNMGTVTPELEIIEIGDIQEELFRGIFKLTYQGDGSLTLKTKVQVNPMTKREHHLNKASHNVRKSSLLSKRALGSIMESAPLAADWPLIVPMKLSISNFKLNGIIRLVVDKTKGVTLVFKNDPLESILISSTFDDVPAVRKVIQKQIEAQLRKTFQHDIPVMIHKMSRFYMNGGNQSPNTIDIINGMSYQIENSQHLKSDLNKPVNYIRTNSKLSVNTNDISDTIFVQQEKIYQQNRICKSVDSFNLQNYDSDNNSSLDQANKQDVNTEEYSFNSKDIMYSQSSSPQRCSNPTILMNSSLNKSPSSIHTYDSTDTERIGKNIFHKRRASSTSRKSFIMKKWGSIYDQDDEMADLLFPPHLIESEMETESDDKIGVTISNMDESVLGLTSADIDIGNLDKPSQTFYASSIGDDDIQSQFNDYPYGSSPIDSPTTDIHRHSIVDHIGLVEGFGFPLSHRNGKGYFDIERASFASAAVDLFSTKSTVFSSPSALSTSSTLQFNVEKLESVDIASNDAENEALWAQIGVYCQENPLKKLHMITEPIGDSEDVIHINSHFISSFKNVKPDPKHSRSAAHLASLLSNGNTLSINNMPNWGGGYGLSIPRYNIPNGYNVGSGPTEWTGYENAEMAEQLILFRSRPPLSKYYNDHRDHGILNHPLHGSHISLHRDIPNI